MSVAEHIAIPSRPDPTALFRAIYDAELAYVWSSLRRLGAPSRDLEDLAHEVFVVVHRLLPDLDTTRPVRPWLFAIAFRVASDYRRRASNVRELLGSDREVEDGSHSAEATLLRDEERALVHAALASLDLDQRAIFILHELDETPVPEAAEALGVPLNTAYSRLRLARTAFTAAVRRAQLRSTR